MLILLILFTLSQAVPWNLRNPIARFARGEKKCPPETDKDSPKVQASCGTWTRADLLACFDRIVDLNCDQALQPNEIEQARKNHLKWWERAFAWFGISNEQIFCSCDTNQDGKISHDEFLSNWKVCMEKEWMLCKVKDVCEREVPNTPPMQCK